MSGEGNHQGAASGPGHPCSAPNPRAADAVCHDEQMTVWTDEIAGSLSMGGYLREDLSYDGNLDLHAAIAKDLRSIIGSAFLQAEPPAPCDEPRDGGDAEAAPGRSPAGAMPRGQAPAQTLPEFIREFKDDPTKAWIRIGVLKAAIAESERKRVEAESRAAVLSSALTMLGHAVTDPVVRRAINDVLARTTPTRETPHVEG